MTGFDPAGAHGGGAGTVVVPGRCNGPAGSGNGGVSAGAFAAAAGLPLGPAEVTLRRPPPLDVALRVEAGESHRITAPGGDLVAEVRAVPPLTDLDPPARPSVERARDASAHFPFAAHHPFPTCFVCGPGRPDRDGLGIFAGPLDPSRPEVLAAPWAPSTDLADERGELRSVFAWAALDCPGGAAAGLLWFPGRPVVLGRFAAEQRAPISAGEQHVVVAWPLGHEGRKGHVATAVLDADGRTAAVAKATWLALEA